MSLLFSDEMIPGRVQLLRLARGASDPLFATEADTETGAHTWLVPRLSYPCACIVEYDEDDAEMSSTYCVAVGRSSIQTWLE